MPPCTSKRGRPEPVRRNPIVVPSADSTESVVKTVIGPCVSDQAAVARRPHAPARMQVSSPSTASDPHLAKSATPVARVSPRHGNQRRALTRSPGYGEPRVSSRGGQRELGRGRGRWPLLTPDRGFVSGQTPPMRSESSVDAELTA